MANKKYYNKMNPFHHMTKCIEMFETNQMNYFDLIGELNAIVNIIPEINCDKNKFTTLIGTLDILNSTMITAGTQMMSKDAIILKNETINNIKQLLLNYTKISVEFRDDTIMVFTYGTRQMLIQMIKCPDGIIIDYDAIKKWLPPFENDLIFEDDKVVIKDLIIEYLNEHGIIHGWI